MTLSLEKAAGPLVGTVSVPGDKSLAHRAALFSALAEGESVVAGFPDSGVSRAMLGALKSLGVESALHDGILKVKGNGYRPFPVQGACAYCGNSATTIRLLAGAVAGTGSSAVLDGSEGLRRRPMSRVTDPLSSMGAVVSAVEGHAPLSFSPAVLHGENILLPVASAQVKSCVILAALGAEGETVVKEPSRSRDHTERMLRAMGADISQGSDGAVVVKPLTSPLAPLSCSLPGDASSAAFLFAAAAIVPGSRVTVTSVGVNSGRIGFLNALAEMGASVEYANRREIAGEPVADVTVAYATLHGIEISSSAVVDMIDEFPVFATVAAFAEGESVVRDAIELRYKESDRIAAIVSRFSALGAEVEERQDGFSIHGGTLKGGKVDALGDHRIAMASALCALRCPVTVENAEILNESFPSFVSSLESLEKGK